MLTTSDLMLQTISSSNRGYELGRKAVQVYRNEQQRAWFHRIAAFLRRECPTLADLQKVSRSGKVTGSHYAGTKTVSIDAIHGTEARSSDFDRHFHPINCRTISRWISIFQARLGGRQG